MLNISDLELRQNATWNLPKPTIVEFSELALNAVAFLIGFPINILTLMKLIRKFRSNPNRLCFLHINLNISDLFVLVIYCIGRVIWLGTFQWRGGEAMCRIMRFLETVGFQISSNLIVLIGFDRFSGLKQPQSMSGDVTKGLKMMTLFAWILAIAIAIPQLAYWQLFTFQQGEVVFTQCVSFWVIANANNNHTMTFFNSMMIYNIGHVVIMFWLPLCCLIVSYSCIVKTVIAKLGASSGRGEQEDLETSMAEKSYGPTPSPSPYPRRSLSTPPILIDQDSQQEKQITLSPYPKKESYRVKNGCMLDASAGSPNTVSTKFLRASPSPDLRNATSPLLGSRSPMLRRILSFRSASTLGNFQAHSARKISRRKTLSGSGKILNRVSGQGAVRRSRNCTIRTTLILLTTYILCWLPYNLLVLWMTLSFSQFLNQEAYLQWLFELIIVNSVINPVIYGRLRLLPLKKCWNSVIGFKRQ